MSGAALFFVMLGAATLTAQVFRILDAIEQPSHRRRRATIR